MKRVLLVVFCFLLSGKYFGQDVPQSERDALVAFYDSLGGDYWKNNIGWKSENHVYQWFGVNKLKSNEPVLPFNNTNVYRLNLNANGLSGELPSQVGALSFLQDLIISNNDITKIPYEIGLLKNLKTLKLNGSNYNRPLNALPSSIGSLSKLEELDLSYNSFKTLPDNLSQLVNLKKINLSHNFLTYLPQALGNLNSLETFISIDNQISGSIPDNYKNLINLKTFKLHEYNGITNSNPKLFQNMLQLDTISIMGYPKMGQILDLSKNTALKYIQIYSSNTEIYNLKNGANNIWTNSSISLGGYGIKCVAVDNPSRARASLDPYEHISVSWALGFQNHFQSDCSSYLSTNESKISDLKIANPVKDLLHIQSSEKINSIEVYSTSGQLVKSFKTAGGNVSDLAKGIYLVKITTDRGVTTQKIIKE